MIRLLIASILFFIPLEGFADERQRELENEAINLVIKKYGKVLKNRFISFIHFPLFQLIQNRH